VRVDDRTFVEGSLAPGGSGCHHAVATD